MNSASRPGAVNPPANRWAVPLFLTGALTLAAVLSTRSLWLQPERCERFELVLLRRALDRPDEPLEPIAERARALLARADLSPGLHSEAHFILGNTLVRQARRVPTPRNAELWKEAQHHLTEAERLGLDETDQPLLHYHLALCGHRLGATPETVAARLEASIADSDDPVEAHRALAEAHLACTPPNLTGALAANEKLRQLPLLGEDVLGPARMQAAELLFRLERPAEARKTLELVGRAADPTLFARARLLRAESLQTEGKWADAARLWQQVVEDAPSSQRELALYQLGYCLWRLERYDDAAAFWDECAHKGSEGPARAAALRLSELQLNGGEGKAAVESLARAVRGLDRSTDWPESLVPLDRARALFDRACEVLRQGGEHEASLRVADLSLKVAEEGAGRLLRAEAGEAWAQALTRKGDAEDRARDLFRDAGGDFVRAAEAVTDPKVKSDRLGRAGKAYLAADDHDRAAKALEAFVGLSKDPAGLGEGWYLLGQARRQLRQTAEAEVAYKEAIKYPTRFAYRARFQLSQLQVAASNMGLAEDTLEQNVKLLRLHPDNEALEQSLYSLATLLFERKHFSMVPFYLDDALARFPRSSHALRGRYQLAESFRQLAAQENINYVNSRGMAAQTRDHHWRQHRHWLEKAGAQFQELGKALEADPAQKALRPEEVSQALFAAAECRFNLGDYSGALTLYERLAEKYRGRGERLRALGGCVRCHAARNEGDKVQEYVQQIRLSLGQVDEATRQAWETWLADASKRYALAAD